MPECILMMSKSKKLTQLKLVDSSRERSESSEGTASEDDELEILKQQLAVKNYNEKVLKEQLAIKERES